jgi:hypothetical protein
MDDSAPSCKAILRAWRANPGAPLPPGYEAIEAMLRDVAAARKSGRLDALTADRMVDGMAIRVGRGDDEDAILAWVSAYAKRRGYTWRGTR